MIQVYPQHLSMIHYCRRGTRQFFMRHNLDWIDFLEQGIDADQLLATHDHMASQLVEIARNGTRR